MDTTKPTSATYRMSRYEIIENFTNEGLDAIAETFRELCNAGENVNRSLNDLSRIVEDNKTRWGQTASLFYGRSTVSNGADFERDLAKYEALELMLIGLARLAEIDDDVLAQMISVAREDRFAR